MLHYYRLTRDRRLVFGGRVGLGRDDDRAASRAARGLHRDMCGIFPELRDVRVAHVWSGRACFAADLMPHSGSLEPGVRHAAGYAGHGIALATWLGTRSAEAMLGIGRAQDDPFRELPFAAIPLYRGSPWFLPGVIAWYRFLDRIS
jgi:glycine/D-amino acid oxidase-like deaminating enzyme